MFKRIISISVAMSIAGGGIVLPIAVFAQNDGYLGSSSSSKKESIDELKKQRDDLRAERDELKSKEKERKEATKELRATAKALTKQLRRGMTDEEVKTLQETLAQDSDVYPEGLITGFFGQLTENAVRRFQRKHGIDQIGQVGPQTRARLHALLDEFLDSGRNLPPGLLKKLGRIGSTTIATSTATSTRGQGEFKVILCHKPDQANETITVGLPALVAHILHGDKVGACTATPTPPPTPTTTPDIIAPVISGVTATNVASTSAHILWTTNENADSKVYYATTTPLATSTATTVTNAAFIISHDLTLSPLAASTTHYFIISSKDAVGNEATSTQGSFLTLP